MTESFEKTKTLKSKELLFKKNKINEYLLEEKEMVEREKSVRSRWKTGRQGQQ